MGMQHRLCGFSEIEFQNHALLTPWDSQQKHHKSCNKQSHANPIDSSDLFHTWPLVSVELRKGWWMVKEHHQYERQSHHHYVNVINPSMCLLVQCIHPVLILLASMKQYEQASMPDKRQNRLGSRSVPQPELRLEICTCLDKPHQLSGRSKCCWRLACSVIQVSCALHPVHVLTELLHPGQARHWHPLTYLCV